MDPEDLEINKIKNIFKEITTVGDKIGYGSFGTILYKSKILELDIVVKVIKTIVGDLLTQKVVDSYESLKNIERHPNVVHCFGTHISETTHYLVLEYCFGSIEQFIEDINDTDYNSLWEIKTIWTRGTTEGDNRRVLNRTKIILKILKQMAEGLAYLHSKGIIHRDIRPSNILIRQSKDEVNQVVPVISDFGFAKVVSKGTDVSRKPVDTNSPKGWVAPEGKWSEISNTTDTSTAELTKESDVFSLGCVFFYVLSNGEHPFGGLSDIYLQKRIDAYKNIKDDIVLQKMIDERNAQCETKLAGVPPEYIDISHDRFTAWHLIKSMINLDQSSRPEATVLVEHPLFWDTERCLQFIHVVSELHTSEKKSKEKKLSNYMLRKECKITNTLDRVDGSFDGLIIGANPGIATRVFNCNPAGDVVSWIDEIKVYDSRFGTNSFSDLIRKHKYKEKDLCCLLRMIRNFSAHLQDGFNYGDKITCYMEIFEKLIIEVYVALRTVQTDYAQLHEFYPPGTERFFS